MEIIRGKIKSAQKVVIYGPEGIGKSTFASKFPDPLFIDTEGSTRNMDVARTEAPSSWSMLAGQVKWVRDNPDCCRTLIIDTADWAEDMAIKHVCAVKSVESLADFGYGTGFVRLEEEFGKLLNMLNEIISKGIHVVFIAHAFIRQTELPEETGKYEFWSLKLEKKTGPLLKEWADMVLFINYKTIVSETEKDGKKKARGGQRHMYTSHRTTWDAKNRHDLPEELPFEYKEISHIFDPEIPITKPEAKISEPAPTPKVSEIMPNPPKEAEASPSEPKEDKQKEPEPTNELESEEPKLPVMPWKKAHAEASKWRSPPIPDGKEYLNPLYDLMVANKISDVMIRMAVAEKKFFTVNTPIENYDKAFVEGFLIGKWDGLYKLIQKYIEDEVPF